MTEEKRSGFDSYIKRIMDEDEALLRVLGSDFDEEGIPYWEKWHKRVDKNPVDEIELTDENSKN